MNRRARRKIKLAKMASAKHRASSLSIISDDIYYMSVMHADPLEIVFVVSGYLGDEIPRRSEQTASWLHPN